jgi:hypothetical protein
MVFVHLAVQALSRTPFPILTSAFRVLTYRERWGYAEKYVVAPLVFLLVP